MHKLRVCTSDLLHSSWNKAASKAWVSTCWSKSICPQLSTTDISAKHLENLLSYFYHYMLDITLLSIYYILPAPLLSQHLLVFQCLVYFWLIQTKSVGSFHTDLQYSLHFYIGMCNISITSNLSFFQGDAGLCLCNSVKTSIFLVSAPLISQDSHLSVVMEKIKNKDI